MKSSGYVPLILCLLLSSTVCSNSSPETLGLQQSVAQIKEQSAIVDSLAASNVTRFVELLPQWESQIESGTLLLNSLNGAVEKTQAMADDFKAKSEKLKDSPQQAKLYKARGLALETQASELFLMAEDLGDALALLRGKIDSVKTSDTVKDLLRLETLKSKTDDAISGANKALPDCLK